jgi:hypothetical protein
MMKHISGDKAKDRSQGEVNSLAISFLPELLINQFVLLAIFNTYL